MHVLIITLSKTLVSSLKWCWIGGNMRKRLVAKIKRVSVDFWWKVCFFLSGFLSSSGSTRQFWISRACCYSESSCVTLLPTKKSPRHWSFINPSDGESLTVFWSEKWDEQAFIWQPRVQKKSGKCIGSRPWSPRQVFIVADDLEHRFEPPLLSRRGSLKKRRVRRFKNGGF